LSTARLSFRPDLQGLRAIAVIAVLIFHVWPKIFKGGFVGVDVFFVISGYLITSLIVGEIEQEGRLDLLRFWGRRMLRLLPAASLVLLAALVGALFFSARTEWINTAGHVFASALYMENWALVAQSVDYWAAGVAPSPVQHYWSLSIEEQFYVIWPPLLALAGFFGRLGRGSVRVYAGILIVGIFGFSLYCSLVPRAWAGTEYFTSVTRAWELALGALLAVSSTKINLAPALRSVMGWVGLAAVIVAIALINEKMRFPGWVALIPTMGTALLILSGDAPSSPYRLLALKPMQYVGDISYSLYLWHWPLIVFFKPFGEDFARPYDPAIVIGATIVLAVLSKYLIEDPFRHGRWSFRRSDLTRRQFIRGAFTTVFAMLLFSAAASLTVRFLEERSQRILEVENEKSYGKDPRYPGAAALDKKNPAPVPEGVPLKPNLRIAERDTKYRYFECMNLGKRCELGDPNGKLTVALIGDSHAMSYGPAFDIIAKRQKWKLLMMVKVACTIGDFPMWSSEFGYRADCDRFRDRFLKWMAEAKPDYIISTGGRSGVYGGMPNNEKQIEGYRSTMNKLLAVGSRMIVMHDNPVMLSNLRGGWVEIPKCLMWNGEKSPHCWKSRHITLDGQTDNLVSAAQGMQGVGVINLTEYMCTKDQCPPVIGNVVVYRDSHHLTETFVTTLVPYLEKELLRVMKALPDKKKIQ
jgi:peptidoglycan/LPS O-acetylase OafA/YrhL